MQAKDGTVGGMDPSHKRPVGDTTGPGSGLKSSVTMTYRHQSTATPATFNFPLTFSYPLLPLIVQSFKTRSHEVIINALQVLGTSYLSHVFSGVTHPPYKHLFIYCLVLIRLTLAIQMVPTGPPWMP